MSRSGYNDDCDGWDFIRWRGAVASAIRGKRGQAFLKEMLAAFDAMPEKKLIANELEEHDAVCAIGAVGKARGVDMNGLDPDETERVAKKFGVADALVKEIVFENDEPWSSRKETPEQRFVRMYKWAESQIHPPSQEGK